MVQSADVASQRPRGLLGLFEDAWRRQRRRRTRLALIALALIIAGTGLLRMDTSSSPHRAPAIAAVPRLASTGLPTSGHFASLMQAGGHLVVTGGPGGWPLNAPGAVTKLAHDRATGRCTAATVISHTVRLGRLRSANCGDPALYGLHVLPIMFLEPSHGSAQAMIGIRIAVADHRAPDGYRLGPTLASYMECSDCGTQWIIGDHALWIDVPLAHGEHGPGEMLRISSTTGRVLKRFATPQLLRALLAVNQDGLWVAPSIETGMPGRHLSRRAQHRYGSVYLIAPGSTRAREKLYVGTGGARWLAAAGRRVWLQEASDAGRFSRILSLTGAHLSQLRYGSWVRVGADDGAELGEGPVPFAASPSSGVDAVVASGPDQQHIVNYNPNTLTEHILATVPQPGAQYESPTAVTDGDAVYFLNPTIDLASSTTQARLYRVTGS
jgi:hypothetical protein